MKPKQDWIRYAVALAVYCLLVLGMVFASSSTKAEYYYVELGVGTHGIGSTDWDTGGGIGGHFAAGHVWELENGDHIELGYSHGSQWDKGYPLNDTDESSYNALLLTYRGIWR